MLRRSVSSWADGDAQTPRWSASLDEVVGPIVYHRSIRELAGEYLAEYDVEQITVELDPDEFIEYTEAREVYRSFVREKGIRFGGPQGWGQFLLVSSRSAAGRHNESLPNRPSFGAFSALQAARSGGLVAATQKRPRDHLYKRQ